ncbi:MAG TPA: hypothetical protein VE684_19820 [Crenalkalicoccus sp.]|nr:hypothetical protein [Crenalkalicoccus sp.]
MRRLPGLAALLALAACGGDPPPPPPAQGGATPAAATPATRTTAFDGRYVGRLTLNPDRTRSCPEPPEGNREITVADGRATFVLSRQPLQQQAGTVGADGSVRLSDLYDRALATTGLFTGTEFLGEYRNGRCSYAVRMQRQG